MYTNFPRNENPWIKRFHQHVVRREDESEHKTQNCAMQGVSHLGERRTMLHDGVERFLFPFIRPSRYSRRAPPRRRIDEKKEKKEERSSRLGGNRKLPCYFSSNTVEGRRRVKRTRNRDAN